MDSEMLLDSTYGSHYSARLICRLWSPLCAVPLFSLLKNSAEDIHSQSPKKCKMIIQPLLTDTFEKGH